MKFWPTPTHSWKTLRHGVNYAVHISKGKRVYEHGAGAEPFKIRGIRYVWINNGKASKEPLNDVLNVDLGHSMRRARKEVKLYAYFRFVRDSSQRAQKRRVELHQGGSYSDAH